MSDASLATDTQSMTVGDSLRNARVTAGLTVSEVATQLNLTVNAVESIEANQFERLPGTTFARGYIRNYANYLGLNTSQLVEYFDREVAGKADANTVQSIDRVGEARRVSRGMVQFSLFVVFLILLGAGYYAWQVFNEADSAAGNQPAVFERVEVERADGSVHVQTIDEPEELITNEFGADEASAFNITDEAAQILPVEQDPATALTEEDAESETAGSQLAEEEQETAVLAPGMGAAELRFTDDCWIRIVDADGKEISSGLKRAGENLAITGKIPLDVRLGYAKGVSITYNGQPVDFDSAIRGGTARFKLGE